MITSIHQIQNQGLDKTRKALEDRIPTLGPILSAIGTLAYKLPKSCDKLLKPVTTNEHTIKDLFSIPKEVEKINFNFIMASFDVKSLFTNVSLGETIALLSRIFVETKYISIIYQKLLFLGY